MPIRVVRILTICLFSCLVGVFVAYKSGYFAPEKSSDKTEHLLTQPLAEETIQPDSKIELDMSDSAFIIASSTKSAVAIDYSLIDVLKKLPSDNEQVDSVPQDNDYEQSPDDVLMSSSKVITTTDKSDLAQELKTAFEKDWRRVFESIATTNDSLNFKRAPRFNPPPASTFDRMNLHNQLQAKPKNIDSDFIQNNLASSSKSIVIADEAHLAQDLRLFFKDKGWREAFGLSENLNEDDLIAQDSVSLKMIRKIDSLSFERSMLMVSSKSMVSVNQADLADSLMTIMKKVLRLRLDSLRQKD